MSFNGKRTFTIQMTIDFSGYAEDLILRDLKKTLRRGNTQEVFLDHEIDTLQVIGVRDYE